MTSSRLCECLNPQYETREWSELALHPEVQDTNCDAWKRLLDLVELAARDGREEFAPRRELQPEDWEQIVTLPPQHRQTEEREAPDVVRKLSGAHTAGNWGDDGAEGVHAVHFVSTPLFSV